MATKKFTDTTGQLLVSFTLTGDYLSAFEAVRAAMVATNPGVSPPPQGVIQETLVRVAETIVYTDVGPRLPVRDDPDDQPHPYH